MGKIQRCVPAWTGIVLFFRPECSVAHVLRVARRSLKHSIFKDTAADPFHGSCVHRHGALNRFFSLLEGHVCGSPEAEGCFDARFSEYMYVFFVICALGLAFSSLRAVGACSIVFYARHSSGLRRAM